MLNTMVDEDTLSRDKKPSPELVSLIKAAASSLIGFKELWGSIKAKGKDEGFNEDELMGYLKPLLKERLTDMQIKYLTHEDYYKQKSKQQYEKRVILPEMSPKQEPEQSYNPEEEIKKIGEIRRAEQKREAEEPIIPDDEDPQALEIQFLKEKVTELEDALKKTEQFKPATQLQEKRDEYGTDENKVFDWLGKRDNGVSCYWYPNYGIELFKTRILSDLNNRGVKMFKRLYFEI